MSIAKLELTVKLEHTIIISMFPTILQIGPLVISTTGAFTALGFFFGSFVIWKKGKEEHYEETQLLDGMLLTSLLSLLGARLGFVMSQWPEKIKFLDLVANPGFSWQAALITGLISLVFYCQKQKWDFFKVADFVVFGLVLGLILVFLGRFVSIFNSKDWRSFILLAQVLMFMVFYFLLLYFDKNYRTFAWYKNKRGEAAPGFLVLVFLIFTSVVELGQSFLVYWPQIFNWSKAGDVLIIVLAGSLFYGRSGDRDLTFLSSYFKKRKEQNQNSVRFKAGKEARE